MQALLQWVNENQGEIANVDDLPGDRSFETLFDPFDDHAGFDIEFFDADKNTWVGFKRSAGGCDFEDIELELICLCCTIPLQKAFVRQIINKRIAKGTTPKTVAQYLEVRCNKIFRT